MTTPDPNKQSISNAPSRAVAKARSNMPSRALASMQVTTDDWAEGATRTTVSEVGQSVTKAGDHERPANDFGGNAGGNTHAVSGGHSGPREQKKPAKTRLRASTSFGIAAKATPQGLEP